MSYRFSKLTELPRLYNYIYDNADKKITIAALAAFCGLKDLKYFEEGFRLAMHITPKQYIVKVKMDKAKELLLNPELKIYEIFPLCGYSSTSNFNVAFKRVVGDNPYSWRVRRLRELQEARNATETRLVTELRRLNVENIK